MESQETVKVEVTARATREGIRSLIDYWEKNYPDAKLWYFTENFGDVKITLLMPPETKVIVPQLIDATAIAEPLEKT